MRIIIYIGRVLYVIASILFIISFWVRYPYGKLGIICLIVASVLSLYYSLVMIKRKKNIR